MPAPKHRSYNLPMIIVLPEMFSNLAFELNTYPLFVSINLSCQSKNRQIVSIIIRLKGNHIIYIIFRM